MNRYKPSNFRPAFGIAAAALSTVTLAVAVVLPVGLSSTCPEEAHATLARSAPAATEVAIIPARIEVVAQPVRAVALEPVNVVAQRKPIRT
jgi:hypothetical protein